MPEKQLVLLHTLAEYSAAARRTAKPLDFKTSLIHAALGLTSDAGEFATIVKAFTIYGKHLNMQHMVEELGDILWFVSYAADCLGTDLKTVAEANIEKLRVRYPDKYSDAAAIARADKIDIGGPQD